MSVRYLAILLMIFFCLGCSDDDVVTNVTLIGSWELVSYFNESTGENINTPNRGDVIRITFKEDEFDGSTARNTFFGEYASGRGSLTFLSLNGTEVAESEWGMRFYQTIASTYDSSREAFIMNYAIDGNILNIGYETSKVMKFKAIRLSR